MDPQKLKDATMIYLLHWIHLTRKTISGQTKINLLWYEKYSLGRGER